MATHVILISARKLGLTALGALALIAGGCGQAQSNSTPSPAPPHALPSAGTSLGLHAHPQAIEPVAGAAQPTSAANAGATAVSVSSGGGPLAQPVSDAVIRRELAASGIPAGNRAAITPKGLAIAPLGAPPVVQEVIAAGNEIAHLPYRFGGGHGTFVDNAYDCSGSISFVFAAAGILGTTMTSGELASWGDPGPGKWITVLANGGHTFMYVAGLRFDTVALAETGSRWDGSPTGAAGFAVRHPPGL